MSEEKKNEPSNQATFESSSNQKPEESHMLPEASFIQLALILGMQAMQSLGLIPNPGTNKSEPNLPLAKFNIDLLEILQQKTKGNLTSEEEKTLEEMLFNLRMQYVAKVNKQ
ncbi:MAG: DUF1844 domain-containing protein [bacterium]|nr:DUF1844 domain-containing protein [bacterium]